MKAPGLASAFHHPLFHGNDATFPSFSRSAAPSPPSRWRASPPPNHRSDDVSQDNPRRMGHTSSPRARRSIITNGSVGKCHVSWDEYSSIRATLLSKADRTGKVESAKRAGSRSRRGLYIVTTVRLPNLYFQLDPKTYPPPAPFHRRARLDRVDRLTDRRDLLFEVTELQRARFEIAHPISGD